MYSVETSTYVLHSLYCPQIGIAGQGAGQAAKFIQNNYIPIPFVIMLLLQFLSMLVDRLVQWSVCVCVCAYCCQCVSGYVSILSSQSYIPPSCSEGQGCLPDIPACGLAFVAFVFTTL